MLLIDVLLERSMTSIWYLSFWYLLPRRLLPLGSLPAIIFSVMLRFSWETHLPWNKEPDGSAAPHSPLGLVEMNSWMAEEKGFELLYPTLQALGKIMSNFFGFWASSCRGCSAEFHSSHMMSFQIPVLGKKRWFSYLLISFYAVRRHGVCPSFLHRTVLVFKSPRTFPIRGFQIYDGPVRMGRCTSKKFTPTVDRYSSAIGFFMKNSWQISPQNNVWQILMEKCVSERSRNVCCWMWKVLMFSAVVRDLS